MQIGYIGLGKMGLAQVALLREKGYRVVAWNRGESPRREAKRLGAVIPDSIAGLCKELDSPKLIWLMVAHGAVDDVLTELLPNLKKGDTIIDGGNSFYKDTIRRAEVLKKRGMNFLDVGTSGGPFGARNGACLMIGGDKKIFKKFEFLFHDLSLRQSVAPNHSGILPRPNRTVSGTGGQKAEIRNAYEYVGRAGAGHFVKMVHNGIEYGMMQAIGEGFEVLRSAKRFGIPEAKSRKKIKFDLDLKKIAGLYNNGSVIESRLVGWLENAFKQNGENLNGISGEVSHSGEGLWTVQTAKELGVPVEIIEKSLKFRVKSTGNPSYTGQVVSALRNQFGGHEVKKRK